MIATWNVSNFKSIRDTTELRLAPLTFFAGANSSGKSTFIQSILLVAQTLANKVSSRSVVLNGTLTTLGQFDDLKSAGSDTQHITVQCTCRPFLRTDTTSSRRPLSPPRADIYYSPRNLSFRTVSCEIQFDAGTSNPVQDVLQTQPRLLACNLECVPHEEDDDHNQKFAITVRYSNRTNGAVSTVDSNLTDPLSVALTYDVALDPASTREIQEEFASAQPIGCMLRHFLPDRIVYRIDPIQEEARALTEALKGDSRASRVMSRLRRLQRMSGASHGHDVLLTSDVLSILRDVLGKDGVALEFLLTYARRRPGDAEEEPVSLDRWRRSLRMAPRDVRMRAQQALQESTDLYDRILAVMKESASPEAAAHIVMPSGPWPILNAAKYLDDFFALSVKYLGPLRDVPRPLYALAPAADPYDVGLRGERTASVLDLHKNKRVRYIPSANFGSPSIEPRPIARKLETAVGDWLRYLDVARSVESKDRGKLGHELRVTLADSEAKHDLTHVGVGVSQVLPILVMCLLAEDDSTLIFEQPELHLHPRVQTLLGDFFLSVALCNKQCIVETHSEYMVDRLRLRIAAASENDLSESIRMYFVEKKSGCSLFSEVQINEYGAITRWPEGFFDQSQQEAENILRAAARKRTARTDRDSGEHAERDN